MNANIIIKQRYYKKLEIDTTEKDIIQIWQHGRDESNEILIQREKIRILVQELQKIIDKQ